MPQPAIVVKPERETSALPIIEIDPVDFVNFHVVKGRITFRHHSSWRFLCLGSYLVQACSGNGCVEQRFDIQGYPGKCESQHLLVLRDEQSMVNYTAPVKESQGAVAVSVVLVAGILFAVILIVTVALIFVWIFKSRRNKNKRGIMMQSYDQTIRHQNMLYFSWLESLAKRTDIPVYADEKIHPVRKLGEGAFGCVYLVHCDSEDQDQRIEMAMKLIKCALEVERLNEFEQEAGILNELEHPNIVKFFGLSVKDNQSAMLFEYMEEGDLVTYLRTHGTTEPSGKQLYLPDLCYISMQVARGMEYLAKHHLVHRDLAARNCLVGQNLVIKISDFGMTRDVYVTDYYKMDSQTLVPLRWLPPESLLYRRFSAESDVWSYGVVLWEIFSYGMVPWYMYSNHEVLDKVTKGEVMEKPTECPENIYEAMLSCWHVDPAERNKIYELREFFEGWLSVEIKTVVAE